MTNETKSAIIEAIRRSDNGVTVRDAVAEAAAHHNCCPVVLRGQVQDIIDVQASCTYFEWQSWMLGRGFSSVEIQQIA